MPLKLNYSKSKVEYIFMELYRYGEQRHPAFRNRRLYSVNGQWYFDTREREQVGPYRDQNEAEKALAVFISKTLLDLNASRPNNNRVQYGAQDGIAHMVEELLEFFSYSKKQGQTAALAWANHRLKKIMDNRKYISNSKERFEVLEYAMDYE